MAFNFNHSAYFGKCDNVRKIMLTVIVALLPGIVVQCYFFSIGILVQILLAAVSAVIIEAIIVYVRRISIATTLNDNSALVTGVLIGISVPPFSPWWLIILGSFFSIVIAKQLYGGLGHNIFNPAMVGYVVLLISFPIHMTHWLPHSAVQEMKSSLIDSLGLIFNNHTLNPHLLAIDGMSQATPLEKFRIALHISHDTKQHFMQPVYCAIREDQVWYWMNLSYLLGGIVLIYRNIIRWHIPISILVTLTCCSLLGSLFSPLKLHSAIFHLFSGATMLGAFFIATDPVTASTTNIGRIIYGCLIGFLVWLIRSFGGYPEGMAFAILLANICVPLIDYYTKPHRYGY